MSDRDVLAALLALRPNDMPPELLLERPEWHQRAACRGVGTDTFFPERGESVAPAKALCARCEVREPCAEAGEEQLHGIWAGVSARSRRRSAA